MSKPPLHQVVREVVIKADPKGNRAERRMAKKLRACAVPPPVDNERPS